MRPWWDRQRKCLGWRSMRSGRRAKNRLLVFHGNEGYALDRSDIVRAFEHLDGSSWEVYVLEYPGYGARPGRPAKETLTLAGERAVRMLRQKSKKPLFIAGESIGSGVACHVAAQFPRSISGVFLITPFDTFANAARAIIRASVGFPVPVPIPIERYNNVRELARYEGPLAVLLAGRDDVIPVDLGKRLYDGYSGRKRLWTDPRATHNTVLKPSASWWSEISEFLLAN